MNRLMTATGCACILGRVIGANRGSGKNGERQNDRQERQDNDRHRVRRSGRR